MSLNKKYHLGESVLWRVLYIRENNLEITVLNVDYAFVRLAAPYFFLAGTRITTTDRTMDDGPEVRVRTEQFVGMGIFSKGG